jgi:glycosyltransferase involved in cell wall biosynthesis
VPRNTAEPIRVGFLTPTLEFGGAERWVAALACGLDPRLRVTGVGIRDRDRLHPPIAEKVEQRCSIVQGEGAFEAIARQSDVLVAWGLTDLSMLSGYRGRLVLVAHGHCDWTINAIQLCLPYATDWTAVSQHATLSFPHPPLVTVIHNGIDVDRCLAGRSREAVRKAWGLRPDEIAIGYVGRMSAEKRPLAVVDAAKFLGRPYRAVLAGGGPHTDLFLGEARQLLGDVIYQPIVEHVGEVYRALDVMLLVSPSEGFSLSLTEAWYCGCPTVSTPVGATELATMHGPLSVSVPVGADGAQLAEAVRRSLLPSNRDTVQRAIRVVAEHYTSEAMCRRWSDYLVSLPRQGSSRIRENSESAAVVGPGETPPNSHEFGYAQLRRQE